MMSDTARASALFALVFAPGYLFFFYNVGFVSDDFSGFRHISRDDGFESIFQPLLTWKQGRPLGHTVWRLQHYLFAPFPIGVFQLWCGALIILQSVLAYKTLLHLQIARAPAVIGASVIGLAPFFQSVYLPVHAAFTEFATTLFLLGLLFAFARKPVMAGVSCAISLLFYEHMLPLVWAPILIFLWQSWGLRKLGAPLFSLSAQTPLLRFIAAFGALFLAILLTRSLFAPGREGEIADFSLGELIARAHHAGMVGMRTSSRIFRWAQRFNDAVGAQTLPLAFVFSTIAGTAVFLTYRLDLLNAKPMNLLKTLFLVTLGVFIVWVSHTIFINPERYPPGVMTGRLANTHSGARLGAGLAFAAVAHFFAAARFLPLRIIGVVGSMTLLNWMALYSHSYGAATAAVWEKKVQFARAHGAACALSPSFRNSVLVLPEHFMDTNTDPVVDWTTHLTPTLFYQNPGRTQFFVVLHENAEEFSKQLLSRKKVLDLNGLTGTGYGYVIGANPKNLIVQKQNSVVLKLSATGGLAPLFVSQDRDGEARCGLLPRRRFRRLNLVPAADFEDSRLSKSKFELADGLEAQ